MNNKYSFTPVKGQTYENLNGITYRCIESGSSPVMQSVTTGWTAECHGISRYGNGRIDWLGSTGGYFDETMKTEE